MLQCPQGLFAYTDDMVTAKSNDKYSMDGQKVSLGSLIRNGEQWKKYLET